MASFLDSGIQSDPLRDGVPFGLVLLPTLCRNRRPAVRPRPLGSVPHCAKMFAASLAFIAVHFYFAPKGATGTYGVVVDRRVLETFASYWRSAFLPDAARGLLEWDKDVFEWVRTFPAVVGTLLIADRVRQRDRVALFGLVVVWRFPGAIFGSPKSHLGLLPYRSGHRLGD